MPASWVITATLVLLLVMLVRHLRANGRRHVVERFVFPSSVKRQLAEAFPQLDARQLSLILGGLRDYFLMIQLAPRQRMVAMPSRAVDIAWHAFILCTRDYAGFCQRAFGRFLHHTPAEGMATPTLARQHLKLAWRLACRREGINPKQPDRLPRLFAIDSQLGITNGFLYHLPGVASLAAPDSRDASQIGCSGGCSGSIGTHCHDNSGHDSSSHDGNDCGGGDSSSGDSGCSGGCGGD